MKSLSGVEETPIIEAVKARRRNKKLEVKESEKISIVRPLDTGVKKRGRPKKVKPLTQQQIDSVSNFTFNNRKVPKHPL